MIKPKKKKKKVAAEDRGGPQQDQHLSAQYKYKSIGVTDIAPNPEQPRKDFDTPDLIKNILTEGVLQPIIVKRNTNGNGNGKGYTLIDGERRLKAASKARLKEIPAMIVPSDIKPEKLAELAMTLNMQRKDLTALEEAEGLKKLKDDYGYTQKKLATIIGKSDNYLSEILSIAKLPEQIKEEVRNSETDYSRHFLLRLLKKKTEQKMREYLKEHKEPKATPKEGRKNSKGKKKSDLAFDAEYKSPSPENDFCLILQYKEDRLKSIHEETLKNAFNKTIKFLGMKYEVSFDIVE